MFLLALKSINKFTTPSGEFPVKDETLKRFFFSNIRTNINRYSLYSSIIIGCIAK